jgi:hypothetical protein
MTANEIIENANPKALVLEPRETFNLALIGLSSDGRLVYSEDKILMALQDIDGMSYEEALDYYQFNTVRGVEYAKASVSPIIITHTSL